MEIRDLLRGFWYRFAMRNRDAEAELWVFEDRYDGTGKTTVAPRPKSNQALLVVLGLAESNGEASRLMDAGGVEWREWWSELSEENPWRRLGRKDVLRDGFPVWIRKGKRMYGVKTVMLPCARQYQGEWERIVYGLPAQ